MRRAQLNDKLNVKLASMGRERQMQRERERVALPACVWWNPSKAEQAEAERGWRREEVKCTL